MVGSDRSGSTILTWCLGQHPNVLSEEESNWLGHRDRRLLACCCAAKGNPAFNNRKSVQA